MTSGTSTDTRTIPPPPPLMRGRLHQTSFVLAMAAGATLVTAAATTSGAVAVVSTAIYVASVLGLFGVSALYHRWPWPSQRGRAWMRRLDHSMIFIFIAGTYTPVCAMALAGTTRTVVLAVVWAGALGGVALQLIWPNAPRWVGVPIYLALGWVAVFVLPDLLREVGVAAFVLLVAGGLLYTAGAVCYAIRRPNPWPTVFGFHEFFHAATVLAALCHYIAIWFVLASTF